MKPRRFFNALWVLAALTALAGCGARGDDDYMDKAPPLNNAATPPAAAPGAPDARPDKVAPAEKQAKP